MLQEEGTMSVQMFVARERELAQLQTFLDRALAGHGQVCFVTGEAGAGKTALATEFARRAQAKHDDLLVAVGQGDAQTGAGDPYLPFREVLGLLTGDVEAKLAQGAITQENASRLRDFLRVSGQALVDLGPDLIDIFVPGVGLATRAGTFLAGKAGWLDRLDDLTERKAATAADTGLDQSRIFEQYTNVLKALAVEQPLIVVVDDLQWADAASINLLFRLGRQIEDSRILILGTYRPADVALGRGGLQHPLEDVTSEFKRYFGDIWVPLGQADEAQGRQFVDAFLDAQPNRLDDDFRQALFRHTRGHPLFTTELLRDMQERGDLAHDEQGRWIEGPALDWETLPARVEGVIEKRIGRLDQELREALTTASVEGEDFTAEVVARVQDVDERGLVRRLSRELDKQHRLVGAQGQQRLGRQRLSLYQFRHNLFQKYLYNSMDEVDRSYLHEDVGNVLEALYGEQADEIAVQLARHFLEAGLDDKALGYLIQAGDAAYRQYANTEAVAHYTHALQIAGPGEANGEQLIHLYRNRGRALELNAAYDAALANYAEMAALAEERADRALQLAALIPQATVRATMSPVHDPSQAEALSAQALALARELGDRVAEAQVLWNLMLVQVHGGDAHQGVDYGEASLAIARELKLREQMAYTLSDLADAYLGVGQLARSQAAAEEGRQLWRELGNQPMLGNNLNASSTLYFLIGDFAGSLAAAEESYKISQAIGNLFNQAIALGLKGRTCLYNGEAGPAIAAMEDALRLSQKAGAPLVRLGCHAMLGMLHNTLGAIERGWEHYHAIRSEAEEVPTTSGGRVPLLAMLAHLEVQQGDLAQAEATIRESAIGLNMEDFRTSAHALVLLARGQHALARQDDEATVTVMDELINLLRKVGVRAYLPEALYLKGQARLAQGDSDEARDLLSEARAEAEAIGERRMLWQILATLAEIEAQRGQVAEAENLRAQAREVITFIADHVGTPELRATFLNLPDVRAVLAESTG
ncbi:MAG: AAA family ATPase [Anaerolineae bacterium]